MTTPELAAATQLSERFLVALEEGTDWVDRHQVLRSLASALSLDTTDLTGQPYAPSGAEHAAVRAAAWHLRRHITNAATHEAVESARSLNDLPSQVRAVRNAEVAGDEHALALALPTLLNSVGRAAALRQAREDVAAARTTAYVAGAALLRRLGYWDLAWSLLRQACPATGRPVPLPILIEEVRLLVSMGLPDHAVARLERHEEGRDCVELLCAAALANAAVGERQRAELLLRDADERASSEEDSLAVAVARAGSAVEFGAAGEVLMHLDTPSPTTAAARRADFLLLGATASARTGEPDRAVEQLMEAVKAAPLYVQLAPLARELLHVLPGRVRQSSSTEVLRRITVHFGLA
ncbi:DNA-binding protein [Streptomyces sp. NPDC056831]|uniref:DNA-binding protein n=1 Tax=Streptomyces sp. NPDC056831 TaxID=3345954 RepID=UPI0036C0C591